MIKFFDAIFNSGIVQSFRMAIKSILSNKMRSFLTMLGIIIGVIALVVLVSIVNGGTSSITNTIAELGNDMVYAQFSNDVPPEVAKKETHDKWISDNPSFNSVGIEYTVFSDCEINGNYDTVMQTGVTSEYFSIMGKKVLMGRLLSPVDINNNSLVCVITEKTAKDYIGYFDCIGETITVGDLDYTIVGVLDDNDNSLEAMMTWSYNTIYVPYGIIAQESISGYFSTCTLYFGPSEGYTIDEVKADAQALFDKDYKDYEVEVYDISYIEDALGDVTSILSIVLGAIAGISLLVGGIGIMNIMLVTVTERTREIGIRKAIGASRGVILRQFLFESVVICLIGCGIGIFMSWVLLKIGSLITASLGVEFVMDPTIVMIAVTFCFVIGILFGLYPANKAAKMNPIDALHYGG
ncbi:MAG: ABC transporter permease [Clostridiales bacterium]|nr:ABC transporter permease [Clostridiales bacterium]MBO4578528.1 ABC transporter permease [Clostridiales bacterium]